MTERGESIRFERDYAVNLQHEPRAMARSNMAELRATERIIAERIIGESTAISRVREHIARIARLDLPVLIQGPTGSGKELVAQALHEASGRSGAFVAFSVAAIAESMFEDALFGHRKGAFTGALQDTPGYLREADRGTAFLDEIGTLAPALQPKLLRVLETRTFRPVGASRDQHSAFRLISATNQPLATLVDTGHFRSDLAERLGTLVIDVPPLAARPDDIPHLVAHFVHQSPANPSRRTIPFGPDAIRVLQSYNWPRHVRELRNVVDRALVEAGESSPFISGAIVREVLARTPDNSFTIEPERQELLAILEATNWDTADAAAALGVDRSTVYRRMRRWRIPVPRRRRRISESP